MAPLPIPITAGGVIKAINAFDELSGIIANPDPTRPLKNAIGASGRLVCDSIGAAPALARQALGPAYAPAGLLCKPYWDGAGFDAPTTELPFSGGQCLDVLYRIRFSYNDNQNIRQSIDSDAGGAILGTYSAPGNFGATQIGYETRGSDGVTRRFLQFTRTEPGDGSPSIEVLSRNDGQPDDCGDPPANDVPGANPPPLPPTITPGVDFGLGDDGEPFFDVPGIDNPVDPTGEPIDFEPVFDLPPEPAAPAPPAGGDGLPGLDDAIAGEAGEVSGGEDGENVDFGPPPEGRVWVGCIVELSADPRLGNIPGTGPTNTVWPLTLGNAALIYGNISGSNVRLSARYSELFRPITSLIVTGCFLQTQIGATAKVFPVSALKCPQNPCEESTDG